MIFLILVTHLKKLKIVPEDSSVLVYATLFARRGKIYPKQLVYAKKTKNKDYVVFPWDRKEFQKSYFQ